MGTYQSSKMVELSKLVGTGRRNVKPGISPAENTSSGHSQTLECKSGWGVRLQMTDLKPDAAWLESGVTGSTLSLLSLQQERENCFVILGSAEAFG